MSDTRRAGDRRPFIRDPNVNLTWIPSLHEPIRWLPRNGEPFSVAERTSQIIIKTIAYLPIYIAIIVTAVLLVQIFGVPFVGGR